MKKANRLFTVLALVSILNFATVACERDDMPGNDGVVNNFGDSYTFNIVDDGDGILPGTPEQYCQQLAPNDKKAKQDCLESSDTDQFGSALSWGDCGNNFSIDAATCPKGVDAYKKCTVDSSICSACIYPAGAGHPAATEYCDDVDNDCDGQTDEDCPSECQLDADCDDGDGCTVDGCNQHLCQHNPIEGCECDADTDCGDAEICENAQCVPVPCEGTTGCREAVAKEHKCVIVDLPDNTACGNATVCDGNETCKAGVCTPGVALKCDDSNACTEDTCNPITGCVNTTLPQCECDADTDCGDAEICENAQCVPVPCEGTTGCREAVAKEHKCVIVDLPDNTACGNATVCDGNETCKAGVCTPGVALKCDDSNACTADSCDPTKGCVNAATELCCRNDSECTASRPTGMPVYLLWGCTKVDNITAGQCVGCEDDGDGICANVEYICNDGYDGDGDLLVDCYDGNCLGKACDSGTKVCNAAHECVVPNCTPTCSGKTCGDDGCGGTCGTCAANQTCSATFQCVNNPPPSAAPVQADLTFATGYKPTDFEFYTACWSGGPEGNFPNDGSWVPLAPTPVGCETTKNYCLAYDDAKGTIHFSWNEASALFAGCMYNMRSKVSNKWAPGWDPTATGGVYNPLSSAMGTHSGVQKTMPVTANNPSNPAQGYFWYQAP